MERLDLPFSYIRLYLSNTLNLFFMIKPIIKTFKVKNFYYRGYFTTYFNPNLPKRVSQYLYTIIT